MITLIILQQATCSTNLGICTIASRLSPVIKEEMHTVHTTVISETLQIDIFRFILQPAAH